MKKFKTEQEEFWHGTFGNEYIGRNQSGQLLASNVHFFSKILQYADPIQSILEFGCNVGMNMNALEVLLPDSEISGIEINELAAKKLAEKPSFKVYNQSILDFQVDYKRDLSLIKGVLIHINPEELKTVYQKLYDSSSKYICIAEYYNPSPVAINYRGHQNKLFKRDFAGEFMELFTDVKLVHYGFAYHRDKAFPQDDITWFLLQK
jgi:spore coat polysaccharide biosynthesis protein SpsF